MNVTENRPVTSTTIATTRRVRYFPSADRRSIRGMGDTRSETYPVRHVGEGTYVERVTDRHTPRRVFMVDPGPYPASYAGLVTRQGSRYGAHTCRTGTWETFPETFPTVAAAALAIGAH